MDIILNKSVQISPFEKKEIKFRDHVQAAEYEYEYEHRNYLSQRAVGYFAFK